MKKRILAYVLTLAMVITSLSMLSFVTFAGEAGVELEAKYSSDGSGYGTAITKGNIKDLKAAYNAEKIYFAVDMTDTDGIEYNVGGVAQAGDASGNATFDLAAVELDMDEQGTVFADIAVTVTLSGGSKQTVVGKVSLIPADKTYGNASISYKDGSGAYNRNNITGEYVINQNDVSVAMKSTAFERVDFKTGDHNGPYNDTFGSKGTLSITDLKQYEYSAVESKAAEMHGWAAQLTNASELDRVFIISSFKRSKDLTVDEATALGAKCWANHTTSDCNGKYDESLIAGKGRKELYYFEFFNTTEGIVVCHTNYEGNMTFYKTGIQHTNGTATNINYEYIINSDNSMTLYIDGKLLAHIENACSSVAFNDNTWCWSQFFGSGNCSTLISFFNCRKHDTENVTMAVNDLQVGGNIFNYYNIQKLVNKADINAKYTSQSGVTAENDNTYYGDPINIGGVSKAWASYNVNANGAGKIFLTVDKTNISKFTYNVGGAEATIDNSDFVAIDLAGVELKKDADGIVYADMSITVTPTDESGDKAVSGKVILSREDGNYTNYVLTTRDNSSTTAKANNTDGTPRYTLNDSNVYVDIKDFNDNTRVHVAGADYKTTKFAGTFGTKGTLNIDTLEQYKYSSLITKNAEMHGWRVGPNSNNDTAYDRIVVTSYFVRDGKINGKVEIPTTCGANPTHTSGNACYTEGDTGHKLLYYFEFYNTDEGIVVCHTAYDGTMTFYKTGLKHENGTLTAINFEYIVNADDSVTLYINGNVLAHIENGFSCVALHNGQWCMSNIGDGNRCETRVDIYKQWGASGRSLKVSVEDMSTGKDIFNYYNVQKLADKVDVESDNAVIKLSYVQESGVAESKYSVRFVATVNTLNASSVGFEISLKGSAKEAQKLSTNTVFKTIKENVGGNIKAITAGEGEYFVALSVNNVPASGTYSFIVKPYYEEVENTPIYGDAYEITYMNGVYQSCVKVIG